MPVAIETAQVAVGTVAVELTSRGQDYSDYADPTSSIAVTAPTTATLFVGSAGVTAATGFQVPAGQTLSVDLRPGEQLFGLLASGAGTASVLRTGV